MYGCSGALSSKFIDLFGNSITTDRIQNTNYMFFKCENENIQFDINIQQLTDDYYFSMSSMFEACYSLIELPKIPYARPQGMSRLFYDCYNLKNIPEDYFDNWDFYEIKNYNYAYVQYMFYNCHSLRNIPSQILGSWNGGLQNSSAYTPYYFGFYGCYVLDAINNLGVIQPSSLTANSFASSFSNCSRIKSLTFKLQDNNIPQTANWKHQNLALNEYVGYAYSRDYITQYSGLTTETQIVDDITYQALKDHPDSWTLLKDYSRYNHDSAVETINSLPDCSAYLATQTSGVNTIKFLGASGAKTDGGAINTLTEEEIAVATAKGWTVSLV